MSAEVVSPADVAQKSPLDEFDVPCEYGDKRGDPGGHVPTAAWALWTTLLRPCGCPRRSDYLTVCESCFGVLMNPREWFQCGTCGRLARGFQSVLRTERFR